MNINVTKSFLPNIEDYKKYIDRIFDNGILTNYWPLTQELEKKLANYLWVENLLLVSNGTIALQVLYKTLWLKGNVITSPFSFVATTSSLIWEWLKPKFTDIDEKFLTIDENKVWKLINNKTSAILWVHVYGNPCNVEKLEKIAKEKNIKLIFDAAHCFNVKYKWKSILNYWDASILSFHSTKLFHTIEWWAIIFKNKNDLEKARKIINFWISWPEKIDLIWINGKMNEFQSAMWLCILDSINNNIQKRKEISDYYDNKIKKEYLWLSWREWTQRNYAYYPIILDNEEKLNNILKELNKNDIYPRKYFKPSLNTINFIEYVKMPISEDISNRVLCLPLYESLEFKDIDLIINIINNG